MGSSLRCLSLWRSSSDGAKDDVPAACAPPPLTFDQVLELLPPNHFRSRLKPVLPTIAISTEIFMALQDLLPTHLRSRKWLQIFSTQENGFSTQSLIASCRENSKHQDSGILLIRTAAQRVIGVFLPTWIDWQQRKYYGTRGTVLFSVDEAEQKVTKYVASDKNDYFMRSSLDGELTFGGGGRGPALKLFNDLMEVQSSTDCPTFVDFTCLLSASSPEVVVEAGVAQTGVTGVELWGFSPKAFS